MSVSDAPIQKEAIPKEVIGRKNIEDDILFARNIAKKIYIERRF